MSLAQTCRGVERALIFAGRRIDAEQLPKIGSLKELANELPLAHEIPSVVRHEGWEASGQACHGDGLSSFANVMKRAASPIHAGSDGPESNT